MHKIIMKIKKQNEENINYFFIFKVKENINIGIARKKLNQFSLKKSINFFVAKSSSITIISLSFNSKKDSIVFWIKIGLLKWGIIIEYFIFFSLLIS